MIAEETLHHVEPRTAGRREVDVESRVTSQPLLHPGILMGSVVIRDEVDFLAARCDFVDHPERFQPFLVAVSVIAHTDDGAIQRVHCCKQRRCSVSFGSRESWFRIVPS